MQGQSHKKILLAALWRMKDRVFLGSWQRWNVTKYIYCTSVQIWSICTSNASMMLLLLPHCISLGSTTLFTLKVFDSYRQLNTKHILKLFNVLHLRNKPHIKLSLKQIINWFVYSSIIKQLISNCLYKQQVDPQWKELRVNIVYLKEITKCC